MFIFRDGVVYRLRRPGLRARFTASSPLPAVWNRTARGGRPGIILSRFSRFRAACEGRAALVQHFFLAENFQIALAIQP